MSGLGVAILCYSQLYILCDIGNEVELAVIKLVNQVHWSLVNRHSNSLSGKP